MGKSWDTRRSVLVFVAAALTAAVVLTCGPAGSLGGEDPKPQDAAAAAPAPPQYPRITTSICYEVDPDWPDRPEGVEWGRTSGVAVDKADRVWLFTRAEPPVQVYTADGKYVRGFTSEQIAGQHAETFTAHFLKIDHEGMIWLADVGNHCIWQMTPEGKVLKVLGTPGEPGEDETHLDKPTDVAVTPSGDVFVADGYGNARVAHFDSRGRFVKAWGKLGTGPGEFSLVHAIVLDSAGRLYVADRNNARVQVFDQNGTFLDQWCNLMVPWGLCVMPGDEIWVCGCSPMFWGEEATALAVPPKDQLFIRFDTTGKARQVWTLPMGSDGEEQPGELNWLHGIALDSQGKIYLTDIMGQRAQKFVRRK